jgi:hypothetical protein
MKRNLNSLNEQISRMKSLFTEERMFGNLVEQEENEVETKELEGITVKGINTKGLDMGSFTVN